MLDRLAKAARRGGLAYDMRDAGPPGDAWASKEEWIEAQVSEAEIAEREREVVRAVLRESISLRLKYPTEWAEFINDPENWPVLNEKSDAQPE